MPTDLPTIETEELDKLFLDPENPRLGRHNTEDGLGQDEILELMRDWSLEELGVSFLESGFWPQEAVIVVKTSVPGEERQVLVVVEGNRRLAALKMIARARAGEAVPARWKEMIKGYKAEAFKRLERIPYIRKPSRQSVRSYLGYRHVTGIKEWNPAEKAEFIAELIEKEKLDYDQVRKRIGSKAPTVRQNYISYRLLLQMEGSEEVDVTKVEERFSVLFLSIKTQGVQTYLDIDIEADPKSARTPVPKAKLEQLANFSRWLFGFEDTPAIITDSRQVYDFGRVLESPAGVEYLERTARPSFATAKLKAGVDESEIIVHIERATDEVGEALSAAHRHKASRKLQAAVKRLGVDVMQLLELFPAVKAELLEGKE